MMTLKLWRRTRDQIVKDAVHTYKPRFNREIKLDTSLFEDLIFPGKLKHFKDLIEPFLDIKEFIFLENQKAIAAGHRKMLRTRLEDFKFGFMNRVRENGLKTMFFVQGVKYDEEDDHFHPCWESSTFDTRALRFIFSNVSMESLGRLETFMSVVTNRRATIHSHIRRESDNNNSIALFEYFICFRQV